MKLSGAWILAAALTACGGGKETAAVYPWFGTVTVTGGTPADVTVTFTATGVTPAAVSVPAGGTITFVNAGTVPHQPMSSPHCALPAAQHVDCPWLNLTAIQPGGPPTPTQQATAMPATCAFHDEVSPPPCGGGGGGY